MEQTTPIFRESQPLRQPRQLIMLGTPPLGLTLLAIWQVGLGHKWGNQPVSNGSLLWWTVFLWLLFLRLSTVRLVTEVFRTEVVVAMRGIWRSRRVPMASIRSARVVTFDATRDYGGYGVRSIKNGQAYIASANCGVRLELDNGSALVIGSRRAEELASGIQIEK